MDIATIDRILTTTRSVKKRLDFARPVEPEIIERCIEIALQSPTGSNFQGWHFMVVTDAQKRAALADIYRRSREAIVGVLGAHSPTFREGDLRAAQWQGMMDASDYLHDHLHEVPVHVIPCIEGTMEEVSNLYAPDTFRSFYNATIYGSILPAAWSLILALRSRGLGAAWTTAHLAYEKEAANVLGIPDHVIQAALLPVAYFTGVDFKPAKRRPLEEVTHWDGWRQKR